jgi:ABC-type antimicrobial peptide transport system permease subunit
LALTGLSPGGELRHLIDRQLKAVELPPEGLVLTSKLAEGVTLSGAKLAIPLGFTLGYGISAFIAQRLEGELYRIPFVISAESFAFAFVVTVLAALVSGGLVARPLKHLDLVAVLKTRE